MTVTGQVAVDDKQDSEVRGAAITRRVLVLGHSAGLLDALARIGPRAVAVYLLVEPSVLAAHPGEFEHPVVDEIRTGRFIFSEEAVRVGVDWHDEVGFDAVLPGKEHAVRAAAAIAGRLGLGYPGDAAVRACTDKLTFREMVLAAGLASPRFRSVADPGEVMRFMAEKARSPIVLKPRNRNGSLGVRYIDTHEDVPAAWEESVNTDEGVYKPTDRLLEFSYMVEEYIDGPEFSVEILVSAGEVVFTNITGKTIGALPWFPEMSHQVPARASEPERELLLDSSRRLTAAMAMCDGLLHSEWRIRGGHAYPIECAVRFPGDRIGRLIELAYGLNVAQAWLDCLDHAPHHVNATATSYAATQFLTADPGTVVAVHGLERFRADHRPVEVSVPRLGDVVPEARDSHTRAGFVVLHAASATELTAAMQAVTAIRVETR
ncbi:ATP-grasp domain-containing protein [Nocardia farcinica]|uniref:ATP-grasp domain-containing protein n=1 Tax=Nocardia farcinica TaxID=37329 RepID=UPI002455B3FF|nr:ATP-grasp domain-containing protein [Nocardia farcinica]